MCQNYSKTMSFSLYIRTGGYNIVTFLGKTKTLSLLQKYGEIKGKVPNSSNPYMDGRVPYFTSVYCNNPNSIALIGQIHLPLNKTLTET